MKFHRMLATSAAVAVLSTVAVASPAAAADDDHALLMTNSDEMAIARGVDGWVNIGLSSRVQHDNVRIVVEVDKKGVDITYPRYGTSAGLSQHENLPAGGIDTARFMLSTGPESHDEFDLTVIAEWVEDGRVRRAEIGEIEVELREHDGRDYDFLSESATVSTTGDFAGWVEMDFLGIAPINSDLEVKIKKGLDEVYYPQGDYTSLHHNARLDGRETDVARIWIDPEDLEPGTSLSVEIEVKYENNKGKDKKEKHEMTIVVD